MTSPIQLIAIDMDGTLLNSNAAVSQRNLRALQVAQSRGIVIVIATGRRYSYAMRVLRSLHLDPATVLITSNGAVTRTLHADLLHRSLLPLESALWLVDHLRDYRNTLVLTFDRLSPNGDDVRGALVVEELDHLHRSIARWMESNAPYIQQTRPIEDALHDENSGPLIQAMLCGTVSHMRSAEKLLLDHEHVVSAGITTAERVHTAHVAVHRTEYPERDLCIVDLLPPGCSKGAALLQLCNDRGIAPDNVLAIGDNFNDLSLFELAGHSVIMANAPQPLQDMALANGWAIGRANNDDGVGRAIEQILASLPVSEPV